ncbi:MAG: hypothetical protein Q9184_001889 [Pyrenodesmia sp. 2 TL-2023]
MCNATFSRASALDLHDSKHHEKKISTTFVHCTPGSKRRRSVFLSTNNTQPLRPSNTPTPPRSWSSPRPPPLRDVFLPSLQGSPAASQRLPLPLHNAAFEQVSSAQSTEPSISSPNEDRYCEHLANSIRAAQRSSHSQPSIIRKPQGSATADLSDSPRIPQPLPFYECRTSKQSPNQIKALSWLTEAAKEKFDRFFDMLSAKWGVTRPHTGTCILVAEDWKNSKPLDLMALFGVDNMPRAGSPRAWYTYGDHATTLARAKVWFSAPRHGVDLDNFLGCGPYKPMDASHLCHHEHCIVHLTYEPADVNQDRKGCSDRARFLRAERRPVPEECTVHNPPCMMQRAAITALEAYYHQFAVLSKAYGLPSISPIPRPRRYIYPTFESHIPCQYSSIAVDETQLVSEQLRPELFAADTQHRPDLTCTFCVLTSIKSFASIMGLWSHIVYLHQDIDNAIRLEVIRDSALGWSIYWELYSRGGKRTNETLAKIEEAQRADFSWTNVMNWKLRWG